jgi:hypothetical protein
MKTIETVQQYNSKQSGAGMMFLNANGSSSKKGYVVTINGNSKLCKTIAECEAITEEYFQPAQTLACYSHGGANTIESEMNN